MMRDLAKLLRPLATRIANMVSRAEVTRVDAAKKGQIVQVDVLNGETREDIEHVQPYGFSAHPHPGAEAVLVFVGGSRDHGLAVAVDDRRHRPTDLAEGEVAVYSSAGSRVLLKANGDVEITSAGDVIVNGGATPVAKEGSATTGHVHTLVGTAGPFPIVGTAVLQVDTIATGAGSPTLKVP